ncbi:MAG: tetratricopeptide repeat protein [Candidatus Thermoplasmatota archaeon]|nr:tetratricopeptide repeat protein [Candidatus Thermoplasmatota archaeon]
MPDEAAAPPKLTIDRRILLHLMELGHSETDFEVPWEAVQEGIAQSINIRRDNLPRTMKKLKEEDLLFDVLKRIKGQPRKRKAYFLTSKGVEYTTIIWNDLSSHRVLLSLRDGSVREMPLKDVCGYLNVKIGLLELFNLTSEEKNLSEDTIRSFISGEIMPPKAQRTGGFVTLMQDAPFPRRFFGRSSELTEIRNWFEEDSFSIMSITGIAGIGKTTLAVKAAMDLEGRAHILWYRFHRWDSLRNVLYSLSRFLDEIGRSGLKKYLDSTGDLRKKDYYGILESSLNEGPLLLVFDDFQRAADEIVDFFSNLKEMLSSSKGVKVIIVGRQVFPFYDRSDVIIKRSVRELLLSGLDRESSKGLLKIRDIDEELFEKIYRITKGHPLFLQLILSAKDIEDQKDIKRYIYEEIFKKIGENEGLLLQIASIYRYPVPSSAFFLEEGLDFNILDNLVEANLIQETSYDEFEAHDIIKEFFYNRLTPAQRSQYHKKASEFFMEQGTESDTVEAMYHLARSGEWLKVLRLASTYGERIISRGFVERFASVLDLIEKAEPEEAHEYKGISHLLKGEVQMVMGRWDRALSEFKRAAALAEAQKKLLISARANLMIGSIETRRGSRDTALTRLQKALRIANELKDRDLLSRVHQALGELYSSRGDLKKAKRYFEHSLEIAREKGDPSLEAAAYIGLGVVYTNQDQLERAIEQFNLAIGPLEAAENVLTMARVKISLGVVLSNRGDHDAALVNFEDAIEICSETGDIRQQAYALSGAAHAYIMKGELDLSEGYLDEALKIFTSLGEKFKIATVQLDYGRLFLEKGEKHKALDQFETSMRILKELGSPFYQERVSVEIVRELTSHDMVKESSRFELK